MTNLKWWLKKFAGSVCIILSLILTVLFIIWCGVKANTNSWYALIAASVSVLLISAWVTAVQHGFPWDE
jgi:hypothetical protein